MTLRVEATGSSWLVSDGRGVWLVVLVCHAHLFLGWLAGVWEERAT